MTNFIFLSLVHVHLFRSCNYIIELHPLQLFITPIAKGPIVLLDC